MADAGSAIVRLYAPFAPVPLLAGARGSYGSGSELILIELGSAISCCSMGPCLWLFENTNTECILVTRVRRLRVLVSYWRFCAFRVAGFDLCHKYTLHMYLRVRVLRTHPCGRGAVAELNSVARGPVTAMAYYTPAGCIISGVALCAGHLMRCDVM